MNEDIYENKESFKDLDFDDENYIEFLEDDEELQELAYLFLIIPWEYSDNYLSGKQYYAMKDLLILFGYEDNLKEIITLFLQITNIWVNNKHELLNKEK